MAQLVITEKPSVARQVADVLGVTGRKDGYMEGNGLEVLEEICPLSARMVVNQVSMKMENERISKLIQDLKSVL